MWVCILSHICTPTHLEEWQYFQVIGLADDVYVASPTSSGFRSLPRIHENPQTHPMISCIFLCTSICACEGSEVVCFPRVPNSSMLLIFWTLDGAPAPRMISSSPPLGSFLRSFLPGLDPSSLGAARDCAASWPQVACSPSPRQQIYHFQRLALFPLVSELSE